MNDDGTVELQNLLDQLRQGDPAAKRAFLDRASVRLRRLAAKMLYGSFPALQNQHDVDSVAHETWLRLIQALDKTDPPTVEDFFRLAAHKIRQVLLDMTAQHKKRGHQLNVSDSTSSNPIELAGNQTYNAERLALWTEFHNKVDTLPEQERAVFEMHYYLDLPQAEIARLLNLHPRKVSYLWVAATEHLAEGIDGLEEALGSR